MSHAPLLSDVSDPRDFSFAAQMDRLLFRRKFWSRALSDHFRFRCLRLFLILGGIPALLFEENRGKSQSQLTRQAGQSPSLVGDTPSNVFFPNAILVLGRVTQNPTQKDGEIMI